MKSQGQKEEGTQMMQLTQVQLAQIVTNAVSKALTQHVLQTARNPPLAAAASTAAVHHMPEHDGKDQAEDSLKQVGSYTRPC